MIPIMPPLRSQAADAMLKDGHTADMDAPWFLQRWEMRGFRGNLGLSNSDQISHGLIKFQSPLLEYPRSPRNGKSGATRSLPTTSQAFNVYMLGVARPTNSPKIIYQGNEDTNCICIHICICKFQWILFYKLLGRLPQGNQYKSTRLTCWELAWAAQVSCFSFNRSWLP